MSLYSFPNTLFNTSNNSRFHEFRKRFGNEMVNLLPTIILLIFWKLVTNLCSLGHNFGTNPVMSCLNRAASSDERFQQ